MHKIFFLGPNSLFSTKKLPILFQLRKCDKNFCLSIIGISVEITFFRLIFIEIGGKVCVIFSNMGDICKICEKRCWTLCNSFFH